jgi:hypothetical protein
MSYRQSKQIVLARHHEATCFGITMNNGRGAKDGISLKTEYFINNCPRLGSGASLSGDDLHRTKASAWKAAADLIQPPHPKLPPEINVKHYPLAERFFKRDAKQVAVRNAWAGGRRIVNKRMAVKR